MRSTPHVPRRRPVITTAVSVAALLTVAACGGDDGQGQAAVDDENALVIATVANADVDRMKELAGHFEEEYPDVTLVWMTFEENELRERVTTDIASGTGEFDVVMLGTYEIPIWAERGWLTPFTDLPAEYDVDDLLPTVREALSFEGTPHALPLSGESSFTMYRTDLLEQAGLEMPAQPTWDDVSAAAAEIDGVDGVNGVCQRGKAGWGENMALLTAMANSFGGRWFDEEWVPQFDTEPWQAAADQYVALGQYTADDAAQMGYQENLESFAAGECAVWVDATTAASYVSDPETSTVAEDVGFALAPGSGEGKGSNWLWSWSFAIPESSDRPEEATAFVTWATSPEYTDLVAQEYGWLQAPAGTRTSLYENPEYLEAAPFADLTLQAIESADPEDPTDQPVPYTGIQYVAIPEFQSIGTAVGNRMTSALSGEISPAQALEDSQWVTEQVIDRTRFIE